MFFRHRGGYVCARNCSRTENQVKFGNGITIYMCMTIEEVGGHGWRGGNCAGLAAWTSSSWPALVLL